MNKFLTVVFPATVALWLLGLNCGVLFAQAWHNIDLDGQVLLPSGNPLVGATVYVMPNDTRLHVRPAGTATGDTTKAGGRYRLNIDADGPIQLRFGSTNSYTNLSHLSGGLKINCFMPNSPSLQKQNVISTIMDAYEWGDRWNEFIPDNAKRDGDVVLYQDGRIVVPREFTELFAPELDRYQNTSGIGRLDNGSLFVMPPERTDGRAGGLKMAVEAGGLRNGRTERMPLLELGRGS